MNRLNVKLDFRSESFDVGTLYLSEKMGRYAFSYEKSFLGPGLEISPLALPLGTNTFTAEKNSDLYDLHGVFADSLPDAWGKKVQDAEFQKIGLLEVTALDRLAFIGANGIGALRYEPAQEFEKGKDIVNLAQLRKAVQNIIEGELEEVSNELLKSGGSAGGARPKFLVDLDLMDHTKIRYSQGILQKGMVPIILKIPNKKEDHYQRIEFVYSIMAKNAGISVPDTFLLEGGKTHRAHYAIKRFDIRDDGERYHTHSYAGYRGINYREARPDYADLLRTTEDLTRDHRNVVEMFRRMVFNFLGCNKDDHAKNFSFIMNKKGDWTLSPHYDMGYSTGENGLHAMAIRGLRRNAAIKDFEKIAEDFDVKTWREIVDKVCNSLKEWPLLAAQNKMPQKYLDDIRERILENIRRITK